MAVNPNNPSLIARLKSKRGHFTLDVNLDIPLQGVSAIFGPSGSGKTSLLRALAGLDRVQGLVQLGDKIWQDDEQGIFVPCHERAVGFVSQSALLFPHLSVRDNLLYGMKRSAERRKTRPLPLNFNDIVQLLSLEFLLDRSPDKLSGGEKQRLALGRALLSSPELLLMDEPLSALDITARDNIISFLEKLKKNYATPIIYVSHDAWEVARLADRVSLIEQGQNLIAEPPEAVFDHLILGSVQSGSALFSLVKTTLLNHNPDRGTSHLALGNQTLIVPLIEQDIGEMLTLRIRAREVSIALVKPQGISIRNCLKAHIINLSENVHPFYVDVLLDIENSLVHARISLDAKEDLNLTVHQEVYALIKTVTLFGKG